MAFKPAEFHKEGKTIRELYDDRVIGVAERRGFVRIVCIDDDVPISMNKECGQWTMVPRAKIEGGCMDAPSDAHTRYGEGVTRRKVSMNDDGTWTVDAQIENFRPDAQAQGLEPVKSRESGQERRLAAVLSQVECLCHDKVANVQGDAGTKKDYEFRLPHEVYKDFKTGMRGYATVYGRNDRIELRHKQTGLSEYVLIKNIK